MDWGLMSEQIVRHVHECLPPDLDSQLSVIHQSNAASPSTAQASFTGGSPLPPEESSHILPGQGHAAPTDESAEKKTPPAGMSAIHAVPGSFVVDSRVSQRLDGLTESFHQKQAALENAIRVQRDDADRKLAEVREVMRRIAQLERRISEQDEDFVDSRLTQSRAEGKVLALQGRQVQLDAKVYEVRDTLATLDRRCASTESCQHRAVTHGEVVDAIRLFFGPFREQLETRLAHLEKNTSELKKALGQASNRELSVEIATTIQKVLTAEIQRSQASIDQVNIWMKQNADTERERHEGALAALKEQADKISLGIKAAETKCHRAESGIAELELTVESMGKRLMRSEAGDTARIRKEMQDSEAGVHRRVEEVRASCVRRIEEISGDVMRERDNRLKERAEVAQEVSSVRASLLQSEQHWRGGIHERLNRLERSLVETVDDNAQTRSSVAFISEQVKQLELEIQGIGNVGRRAEQLCEDKHQIPQASATRNHRVPLSVQLAPPFPQTSLPVLTQLPPSITIESNSDDPPGIYKEDGTTDMATAKETFSTTKEGREETGSSRDAQALVCDIPPAEDFCSVSSSSIPGQVLSTQATATQAKLSSGSRGRDHTAGSLLNLEKGPSSSFKLSLKSTGSIDPEGDSALSPPVTVDDGSLRLENKHEETLKTFPVDDDTDRLQVAQVPPKASMDHLRKAVLAAVSLSAEDDAAVASNESIGSTTLANQRLSSFAGMASPPSSPLSSSPSLSPTDPSPLSPCGFLSKNGSEAPEIDAAGAPRIGGAGIPIGAPRGCATKAPTRTEASLSTSNLVGAIPGVRKATDTSPTQTTTLENRAVESAEQSGACSNLSGDGGVGEISVTLQQRTELQRRLGDSSIFQADAAPSSTLLPKSTTSKIYSRDGRTEGGNVPSGGSPHHTGTEDKQTTPRRGRVPPPPQEPPQLRETSLGGRRKSVEDCSTGPTPVSFRNRSASKESGVVTAQCEFCLRRYLKATMSTHLQSCELRLVRCPFQCGVKVLVRNVEKHKNSCSKRNSAESKEGINSPTSLASTAAAITTTTTTNTTNTANNTLRTNKVRCETDETAGEKGSKGPGPGDVDRTVTCMRCHESLPFLLVPSHGPKCKGKKVGSEPPEGATAPAAAAAGTLSNESPRSKGAESGPPHLSSPEPSQLRTTAVVVGAGSSREGLLQTSPLRGTGGKIPASLPSSGDFGSIAKGYPARSVPPFHPPSDGARALWQETGKKGTVLTPDVRIPPSPPRPKSVRAWGTRQVTSWLREIMRPPRADIISRFHESGVVGTTLLGLTERFLLHPTEGMGITDEGTRRQILEAVDTLAE